MPSGNVAWRGVALGGRHGTRCGEGWWPTSVRRLLNNVSVAGACMCSKVYKAALAAHTGALSCSELPPSLDPVPLVLGVWRPNL